MRHAAIGMFLMAACAPVAPDPVSRAETCRMLFQVYDRDVALQPPGILDMDRGPLFDRPEPDLSGLRQYRCVRFASDLAGAETDLSAFAAPPPGSGAARYVHMATMAGDDAAAALAARMRALGYRVTLKGAPGLGRRVFAGPLRSPAEVGAALRLAGALGLDAAYTLSRIP